MWPVRLQIWPVRRLVSVVQIKARQRALYDRSGREDRVQAGSLWGFVGLAGNHVKDTSSAAIPRIANAFREPIPACGVDWPKLPRTFLQLSSRKKSHGDVHSRNVCELDWPSLGQRRRSYGSTIGCIGPNLSPNLAFFRADRIDGVMSLALSPNTT